MGHSPKPCFPGEKWEKAGPEGPETEFLLVKKVNAVTPEPATVPGPRRPPYRRGLVDVRFSTVSPLFEG